MFIKKNTGDFRVCLVTVLFVTALDVRMGRTESFPSAKTSVSFAVVFQTPVAALSIIVPNPYYRTPSAVTPIITTRPDCSVLGRH